MKRCTPTRSLMLVLSVLAASILVRLVVSIRDYSSPATIIPDETLTKAEISKLQEILRERSPEVLRSLQATPTQIMQRALFVLKKPQNEVRLLTNKHEYLIIIDKCGGPLDGYAIRILLDANFNEISREMLVR